MAGSLQDQLLKAGVVGEKRAKAIRHGQKGKNKGGGGGGGNDEAARRIQTEQAEKAERDRELNRRRKEEAERKAQAAQLRQLIEANRVKEAEGETAYHFSDGGKVKRILVSAEAHARIGVGTLAVARLDGRYLVVTAAAAEKIQERDPACLAVWNRPEKADGATAEEDPYAAYQVPDDLIW